MEPIGKSVVLRGALNRGENLEAVAAVVLGCVERRVGVTHQRPRIHLAAEGHFDAEADETGTSMPAKRTGRDSEESTVDATNSAARNRESPEGGRQTHPLPTGRRCRLTSLHRAAAVRSRGALHRHPGGRRCR